MMRPLSAIATSSSQRICTAAASVLLLLLLCPSIEFCRVRATSMLASSGRLSLLRLVLKQTSSILLLLSACISVCKHTICDCIHQESINLRCRNEAGIDPVKKQKMRGSMGQRKGEIPPVTFPRGKAAWTYVTTYMLFI